jgi:hypothetical protein
LEVRHPVRIEVVSRTPARVLHQAPPLTLTLILTLTRITPSNRKQYKTSKIKQHPRAPA